MLLSLDMGMEHIGVIVESLEESTVYFQKLYGVKKYQYYDYAPLQAWSYGRPVEGYRLKIAMGSLGGSSSMIELIQPVSGEGIHMDFLRAGGRGVHHIAYKVDDYPHWKAYYQQVGARFLFEAAAEDPVNGYRRCFYVEEPAYGIVVEIKEKAIFR